MDDSQNISVLEDQWLWLKQKNCPLHRYDFQDPYGPWNIYKKTFEIFILIRLYWKLLRILMGSDFIPNLQGVHQHSLEWPWGANAPMNPPVSAPAHSIYLTWLFFHIFRKQFNNTYCVNILDVDFLRKCFSLSIYCSQFQPDIYLVISLYLCIIFFNNLYTCIDCTSWNFTLSVRRGRNCCLRRRGWLHSTREVQPSCSTFRYRN